VTDDKRERIKDWAAETRESINARLAAAKAAQSQTRFTIVVMAVISMMMVIASYNAYLSYDHEWILQLTSGRSFNHQTVSELLTTQALQDWAAARTISIGLLGIRVSVDDAAVLGAVALFVLSLWLMLVTRRENHTVGFLLRDTDSTGSNPVSSRLVSGEFSSGQRWLILHTILSNNLFVAMDPSLARVDSLDGGNPLATRSGLMGDLNRIAFGLVREFFFFFPAVASLFVFTLDRYSYFAPDAFLDKDATPGSSAHFFFDSMIVFVVCWLPLALSCWRSSQYSRATEKVLREYAVKLRGDLAARGDAASEPSHARPSARFVIRPALSRSKRRLVRAHRRPALAVTQPFAGQYNPVIAAPDGG